MRKGTADSEALASLACGTLRERASGRRRTQMNTGVFVVTAQIFRIGS